MTLLKPSGNMDARILFADEADLVLIGIETILKHKTQWELITIRSGEVLLETTRRLLPEVILFNEHLDPLIDVLALVERLKHASPQSRLLVLGDRQMGY